MNSALLSPWPTAPSTFMRVMGNSVYDIETQEFISCSSLKIQLPLFIFIYLFLEEIVHSAQDSKDTKRYRVKRKISLPPWFPDTQFLFLKTVTHTCCLCILPECHLFTCLYLRAMWATCLGWEALVTAFEMRSRRPPIVLSHREQGRQNSSSVSPPFQWVFSPPSLYCPA